MTDFKSELREILKPRFCENGQHSTHETPAYSCMKLTKPYTNEQQSEDIIALFISKGYMTGQEWYNKFEKLVDEMSMQPPIIDGAYLEAAQRASGIKGEIE